MKKLFFVPALVGLMLLNSCQTEQPEQSPIDSFTDFATPDVKGAYLAFESLAPTGIEANPPLFAGIVGVVALTFSLDHYFMQHRQTHSLATDGVTALPRQYLLEGNPYEIVGIGHNKGLLALAGLNREVTAYDLQQDAFMLPLIRGFGNFTSAQEQALLADARALHQNTGLYNNMLNLYAQEKNNGFNWELTKYTSAYHKAYLTTFFADVDRLDKKGDYKHRLYTKTNESIAALLAEERTENSGLIVALTVFKHSYEYWY